MYFKSIAPLILLTAILVMAACEMDAGELQDDPLADAEEWTLEEDLRIDEEEDFYVGTVSGLALSGAAMKSPPFSVTALRNSTLANSLIPLPFTLHYTNQ